MSKRKLEIHKSGEPMHVNKMHVNKMLKTDDAYHNKILDAVESVVIPFGLTLLPEKYTEKRDDYVWMSRLPMPDNPKCCAAIIKKLEDEKFSVPHTYMQYLYGVVEDDEESQKQNEYNNKILAAVQSVIIPFGLTLNKEVDSQKLGDYAWITRLPSPTDPKCCTAIIKKVEEEKFVMPYEYMEYLYGVVEENNGWDKLPDAAKKRYIESRSEPSLTADEMRAQEESKEKESKDKELKDKAPEDKKSKDKEWNDKASKDKEPKDKAVQDKELKDSANYTSETVYDPETGTTTISTHFPTVSDFLKRGDELLNSSKKNKKEDKEPKDKELKDKDLKDKLKEEPELTVLWKPGQPLPPIAFEDYLRILKATARNSFEEREIVMEAYAEFKDEKSPTSD